MLAQIDQMERNVAAPLAEGVRCDIHGARFRDLSEADRDDEPVTRFDVADTDAHLKFAEFDRCIAFGHLALDFQSAVHRVYNTRKFREKAANVTVDEAAPMLPYL